MNSPFLIDLLFSEICPTGVSVQLLLVLLYYLIPQFFFPHQAGERGLDKVKVCGETLPEEDEWQRGVGGG